MNKIFLIGWKDVRLAFRDRAALLLMLVAPFVLTLGLGFVTGRFSNATSSGISNIPVAIINQDGGQLGNALVNTFQSKDLAELVSPTVVTDEAAARKAVDEDKYAALIVVPKGFTESIIPAQGKSAAGVLQINLYANPTRPTSVGVVKTILEEYLNRIEMGRVSGTVVVTQLVMNGLIKPQEANKVGAEIGARQGESPVAPLIRLKNVNQDVAPPKFDVLALLAPGMALMFLMYTVSNGGRTLLAERDQGTLPRLLVSPTSTFQVLAGKVLGIFLTGVLQMLILIGGTTLMFGLDWGDPLAVMLLVLAAVFGAVGWGILLTSLAKTAGQISAIGSAMMLLFGILGGTFINLASLPVWFQMISKITPNAWGIDGFTTLALGGGLAGILTPLLALVTMGVVLFGVAAIRFNRRNMIG